MLCRSYSEYVPCIRLGSRLVGVASTSLQLEVRVAQTTCRAYLTWRIFFDVTLAYFSCFSSHLRPGLGQVELGC